MHGQCHDGNQKQHEHGNVIQKYPDMESLFANGEPLPLDVYGLVVPHLREGVGRSDDRQRDGADSDRPTFGFLTSQDR